LFLFREFLPQTQAGILIRISWYKTDEEYGFAIADAMRVEYEMIASAGFLVHVDDPWLAARWESAGIK
jgi:5-methyltetrahydropteroyltriglutamate--homocysteine methyltransferase